MTLRRRYARASLSWLALVATLVANVPHFDCTCPNGNRKPFCLSFLWTADCCCPAGHSGAQPTVAVGPSTAAAGSADPDTSCCHCHSRTASRSSPDRPVASATAPCCQKTFVPGAGEAANPAPEVSGDAGLLAVAGGVTPAPLPARLPLPAAASRVASDGGTLPPPDLVITLRHLVI